MDTTRPTIRKHSSALSDLTLVPRNTIDSQIVPSEAAQFANKTDTSKPLLPVAQRLPAISQQANELCLLPCIAQATKDVIARPQNFSGICDVDVLHVVEGRGEWLSSQDDDAVAALVKVCKRPQHKCRIVDI
jgi:hypothetical protein